MAKKRKAPSARKPRSATRGPHRAKKKPTRDTQGTGGGGAQQPVPSSIGVSASWTPANGEVGIRVRMYRVGFGDFFLITILSARGSPLHMVVDCGVFKGTSQTGDIQTIEAAVAHMAETTKGRLSLIVMTHRHADHIAGFARCTDLFKKMTVEGVWLPIWESEYDASAVKFQAELTRTALGLRRHFALFGARASEEQNTARKYMENATGELGVAGAAAAGSNAKALDLLKRGFSGVTPSYYKAGDKAQLPQSLSDAGFMCQVLGPPPISDLDLMKLMDLQKGVGQYLTENGGETADFYAPFGPEWEVDPTAEKSGDKDVNYAPESFREWLEPRQRWEEEKPERVAEARKRMEGVLHSTQPIAALMAAKKLNAFLNNQSLVLLFTFKGKKLLFVGDAQAGNWEHWLLGTDKPDKKVSGPMRDLAREILTGLDFYKVGHHGSGNATPKMAAEVMCGQNHRFVAMCSTEAGVYGTEDPDDPQKGTEVPRGPLLDTLASQAALVRSDQFAAKVNGKTIAAKSSAPLPNPIPGSRLQVGDFWVDCYL